MIARAYAAAGVNPNSIQYIEAHATGTPIGDPSELRALKQVFGDRSPSEPRVVIGSVKRNIGHLLSAAGIASLLKVLMSMRHGILPPSRGACPPIAGLDEAQSPFELLTAPKRWEPASDGVRRAAINSFGFGGTNCHVILESFPMATERDDADDVASRQTAEGQVLCLSAPTEEGLARRRTQLADYISACPNADLAELCRTEMVHTTQFDQRWAGWVHSTAQAETKLRNVGKTGGSVLQKPVVAFLFTGQGSQRAGVGAELYLKNTRFRDHYDEVAEICSGVLGRELKELAFDPKQDELLAETEYTQPAVFCFSYALARVLQEAGVVPEFVFGHSIGEYAAAAIAGIMQPKDAAYLVARRGLVMRDHGGHGSVMALFCDESQLHHILENSGSLLRQKISEVWLAGSNGTHVVAAGTKNGMEELAVAAHAACIVVKKLRVSRPFHTPLLAGCRDVFLQDLKRVNLSLPEIKTLSNVTGKLAGEQVTTPEYWIEHALKPVRFAEDVRAAATCGVNVFIEIGPTSTLAGTTRSILESVGAVAEVRCQLAPRVVPSWKALVHRSVVYTK